jgi:hypothetical protein
VEDYEQVIEVSKKFIEEGVDMIDLCPGFGDTGVGGGTGFPCSIAEAATKSSNRLSGSAWEMWFHRRRYEGGCVQDSLCRISTLWMCL